MTKKEWQEHIVKVTGLDMSTVTYLAWKEAVASHRAKTPGCPECAARQETKHEEKRNQPSQAQVERWLDAGYARATDGCKVEPDGHCEHGCPSWLLELGLI